MSKTKKSSKSTVKIPSWYTGYKSNNVHYGNSSFWLDDDFMDKATAGKGVDVMKLAGYKRAISNFVRIVTNRDNINVKYSSGNDSYTDGKNVTISAKLDEKEFDSTVGLALHEGSHILLTDFQALPRYFCSHEWIETSKEFFQSQGHQPEKYFKSLVNIIEDRRIDRYVYDSAPGYQGYYKALYDKYFNADVIDTALINNAKTSVEWDTYIFHICNFTNPNRKLKALPGLMDIWNVINLPQISRLKSTDDTIKVAKAVFDIINSHIAKPDATNETPNSPDAKQNPSNTSTNDDSSEYEVTDPADSDDDSNGMDPNLDLAGSSSDSKDSESTQQGSDTQADASDDTSDDTSDDAEEDAEEEESTPLTDKEIRALEKAIDRQQDFLDGNLQKKSLSKKDSNTVEALASSDTSTVAVGGNFTDSDGNHYNGKSTACLVVRGYSNQLVDTGLLNYHLNERSSSRQNNAVNDGIVLGNLLGKQLKTRDEERTLQTSRLETGAIDRRLVAELGFGNVNVFKQVLHNTVSPALIHISIDASGSMCGDKWYKAVKTATAIAKACSMTQSIQCIISLRGEVNNRSARNPLMWIVYDSRKDSFRAGVERFKIISAGGSTPEGLCFEAIYKEIVQSANGRDAYLINICDGEPGYSNNEIHYCGDFAVNHSKLQVDKVRRAGIKVISYFVYDYYSDTSWGRFKTIYGADALKINLSNLSELSRSINNKFIRK